MIKDKLMKIFLEEFGFEAPEVADKVIDMLRYEHADFEDSPNNTEDFNFFLLDWGRPVGIGRYEKWRRDIGL